MAQVSAETGQIGDPFRAVPLLIGANVEAVFKLLHSNEASTLQVQDPVHNITGRSSHVDPKANHSFTANLDDIIH